MAFTWTQRVDVGNGSVRGVQRRYHVIAPPDWVARRIDGPSPLPVVIVLHDGGNPYSPEGTAAAFVGLEGPNPTRISLQRHTTQGSELYPSSLTLRDGITGPVPYEDLFVAIFPEALTYRPLPIAGAESEVQDGGWNEHASLHATLLLLDDTEFIEAVVDEVLWQFQVRLDHARGIRPRERGPLGQPLRHIAAQGDGASFALAPWPLHLVGHGSGGNLAFKVLARMRHFGVGTLAVVNGTIGGFRQWMLKGRMPPEIWLPRRDIWPPHTLWIQGIDDDWWPLAIDSPHRHFDVLFEGNRYVAGKREMDTMRLLGAGGAYHPVHLEMSSATARYAESLGFTPVGVPDAHWDLRAGRSPLFDGVPAASFRRDRFEHFGPRRVMVTLQDQTAPRKSGHRYVREGEEGANRVYTKMIWEFVKNPDVLFN